MSSSQRSQLQQRASQNDQAPFTPSAPSNGWMNGGFNRGNSSSMNQRPSSFSGFGSSRQVQTQTQSPTFINETPQIQPRPSSGGMFGGLDRNGRGESPRIDSIPQRQESIPRMEIPPIREPRSSDSGWKGSHKSDDEPSSFSGSDDGSSRGGLRKFQR
jgi:hypothetical protein